MNILQLMVGIKDCWRTETEVIDFWKCYWNSKVNIFASKFNLRATCRKLFAKSFIPASLIRRLLRINLVIECNEHTKDKIPRLFQKNQSTFWAEDSPNYFSENFWRFNVSQFVWYYTNYNHDMSHGHNYTYGLYSSS